MVKIRLRRVGGKKQASFRVVVADSRAPRDGRFIEQIGFYNPRTDPETLRIDEARALHWLNVGAQPTDSAARLLKTNGTMDRFERLKQGESIEDLVTEAEEAEVAEVDEETVEEEAPEAEVEEPAEAEIEKAPEATEEVEETEEAETEAPAEEPEAEGPAPEVGEEEDEENREE